MAFSYKLKGLSGLQEYLKKLLESEKVDEILIPKLNSSKDNFVQTLISSSNMIEDVNPFVPVIPVQTGRIVKNLTFTDSGKKILIFTKPCEIKAIVELSKFKQVNLNNIFLVAVDCSGTYEMNDFQNILINNRDYIDNYHKTYSKGEVEPVENHLFRKSCNICVTPAIDNDIADAVVGYYGATGDDILITLKENFPLKELLEGEEAEFPERDAIIEKVKSLRAGNKKEILNEFRLNSSSLEGLQQIFSKCIRCHNCMVACPICYCKECVFRSPTFDHSSDMITTWAERKGGLRMLENTLMFHLTRLNHMSSSCVSCGLCSSACPNEIDVATVFISVSENVQNMLNYRAGEKLDEPAPVSTFRENELIAEAGTNE